MSDIQGNLFSVTDALGRETYRYSFDLAKRRWRMDSIDAGRRDTVPDALGRPTESRDSKGAVTVGAFDLLHRPTRTWARDDATSAVTLRDWLPASMRPARSGGKARQAWVGPSGTRLSCARGKLRHCRVPEAWRAALPVAGLAVRGGRTTAACRPPP